MNIKYLKEELIKIEKLFNLKKFNQVITKSKKIIEKDPNQTPFRNYWGLSNLQLNKYILAEKIFLDGLKLNPNEISFLSNLSSIYRAQNNFIEAEKYIKKALDIDPGHFISLCNYGNLKGDLNQIIEAENLYLRAYKINKNSETLLTNLATTFQYTGKFEESKNIIKEINLKFPNNFYSHHLFSRIHKYEDDDPHQKLMLQKNNDLNTSNTNKIYLCFALTKSFLDQKNYEKASYYSKIANKLKHQSLINFDFNKEIKIFELIKRKFTDYNFNQTINKNLDKMIFIVGLPRSGTTLLHQIIGAHSRVFGAGELTILSNFFNPLIKDDNFFNILSDNNFSQSKRYKEIYNKISKKFKQFDNDKIIMDKLPTNFKWIGFIKIFFPNSKIIHCNRNLKDTALSIYNNMFEGEALPWSYEENNLIAFINLYKDLLNFWRQKIPNFIYDCHYEELIDSPKDNIKKILEFCDLKFEENCINFHQTNSVIKTVSVNQARSSIYNKSINQSSYFETYFDFLKKL